MILSSVQSSPPRAAIIESETDTDRRILRRRSWLEMLAITVVIPIGGLLIHPEDPFLLGAAFPWLVLVPLLVGAQHGALAAALHTALLFAMAWGHAAQLGRLDLTLLGAWGGGLMAAGVIAGYFRDRIDGRLTQLARQVREDSRRLARLSRAHAVLKLSHQRLEERLSAQGWSLESAVEDARQELAASTSLPALCESILSVLSNHTMVQAATLFTVVSEAAGASHPHELALTATLGGPPRLDARNRLIERALSSGRLVALDAESSEPGCEEPVLAAVPLVAASGRPIAVVAVHEMPFMAFQATNLKALAALGAHLADVLEERLHPASETRVKGRDPDAPLQLAGAAPSSLATTDEFVGTRTGTHRRRSVAQSA